MKFITASALFLWLGTSITLVSAVDISVPSFDLLARDFYHNDNHTATQLYHRAVANYDNGLYDRDLADLDERDSLDDLITRALSDEFDKRDFDGEDIEKRQAQLIAKAGEMIWKLVSSIKGQLDKEKDARGKYTSTLAGKLCASKPQFNWIIIHDGDVHFDGVRGKDWGHMHKEFPLSFLHRTMGYEVFYGKSGKVVRKGDGGWLNWGFCGHFTRTNDRYVTFTKP